MTIARLSVPAALGLVALATGTTVLALWLLAGDRPALASQTVLVAAASAAMLGCVWRARTDGHRLVWTLLASAFLLYAAAEAYWLVQEAILGRTVAPVSLADGFYILGYGVLAIALGASFPQSARHRRARLGIDALAALTATLAIAWIAFGRDIMAADSPPGERIFASIYPLLDLALLVSLFFVVRELRPRHRPTAQMLAGGLFLMVLGDVGYAYHVANDDYMLGQPLDAAFLGAYIAFALAPHIRPGPEDEGRNSAVWANAVYLPVIVLIPLSMYDYWRTQALDPVLFMLGIVLITALAGRQVLYTAEVLRGHRDLERQTEALEHAQAIARVGSWELDLRTQRLDISHETARILGVPRRGVTLEHILGSVHPDDVRRMEAGFRSALDRGAPFELEYRVIVDGQTRHVVQRGLFEHRRGRVSRALGIVQDVSERRQSQQRLEFQSHLLDSVSQAVIATTLDGTITYWNAAAERLYGWSAAEALGQPVLDVTPAETTREQAAEIFARLKEGKSWIGEFRLGRKDGTTFLAEVRDDPLFDAEGKLVGVVGVSQDITQRKRMEVDLGERVKELRALSGIAERIAHTNDIASLLRGSVSALSDAFLYRDAWVRAMVADVQAASPGARPTGPALRSMLETAMGVGEIEVLYTQAHPEAAIGPFLDEEQRLLDSAAGLLSSAIDRIHAMAELKHRERALAEAQHIAKLGSWWWNPPNDKRWWSEEMYRIFERDPSLGPPDLAEAMSMLTPETALAGKEAVEKAFQLGGSFEVDVVLVVPRGVRKSILLRGHAALDPLGQLRIVTGTMQDITDRATSEERLRFQANLLQEVRQAVMATDLQGSITFWNPAAERLFGWTRVEALGRHVTAILGEAVVEESRTSGAGLVTADHWIRTKDGTRVLISLATSPILHNGTLSGFIGVCQDVTRERAMQRRYRGVVDHSPAGIFRTTWEGRIEVANPEAARMLGYDSVDHLLREAKLVTDVYFEPADRENVLLRELEKPRPGPVRVRFKRRDGSPVWVEILAQKHEEAGKVYIEGSFRDLTTEMAHQELASKLAAVVESSEEAIYSLDLDGRILTWNPAAESLYGYSAAEAVGEDYEDLAVPDEWRPRFRALLKALRRGDPVPRHDTVRRRKDGSVVDVSVSMVPMRDALGNVTAISAMTYDIAPRLRAEETERARLENEHLRQLDQTLRDFINAAAHDLNQPLTPMRLALTTLEESLGHLPPFADRSLKTMKRSVDRMALLVADLLDVARLESGTLQFEFQRVDLRSVLAETEDFFGPAAEEKGINWSVEDPKDMTVVADARRLMQVLVNLVGNAFKYAPGGNVRVFATRRDGSVRIHVQDDGKGLTPEQISRLFRPFSQVHRHLADAPPGTGLGLYITKGIVEQHGGSVGVESAGPGQGSTFWFEVPVAMHGEEKDMDTKQSTQVAGSTNGQRRGGTR